MIQDLSATNPQADIFRTTRDLHQYSADWVAQRLQGFCDWGMPDEMMASRLTDEDMYRNPALQRMLLAEEAQARLRVDEPELSLAELASLNRDGLTVEHILPQEPGNSFNTAAHEFPTSDEYMQYVHRLGNLVLLEGGINSACNNHAVESKISYPNLYLASSLSAVKAVAAECADNSRFSKLRLVARSQRLSALVVKHWPIR